MAKITRRITLDPDAARALDDVGNASAYLSALATSHLQAWQEALQCLRVAGWESPEIMAACRVVWSLWVSSHDGLGLQIEADMVDSDPAILAEYGIDAATWSTRAQSVLDQEPVARALWIVSRELVAGNLAVRARLARS